MVCINNNQLGSKNEVQIVSPVYQGEQSYISSSSIPTSFNSLVNNIVSWTGCCTCKSKDHGLYGSLLNRVNEMHQSHVGPKSYSKKPGVGSHQQLQLVHPRSCSVMQILNHLISFILASGFAIEINVIALTPSPPHDK